MSSGSASGTTHSPSAMEDTFDIAGLIRPGDRLAWHGGSTEPTGLLAILEGQLDRLPHGVSTFLNFSLIDAIDAGRLARAMRIRALGGAVTNRRFRAEGNLEIVPVNYSTLPALVAAGQVPARIFGPSSVPAPGCGGTPGRSCGYPLGVAASPP